MIERSFSVKKLGLLNLGYQFDHKATKITFTDFECLEPMSTVYLKFEGLGLYPLTLDLSFEVGQAFTLNEGKFVGQLIEVGIDNSVLQNSAEFTMVVKHSLDEDTEIVDSEPELDLWFTEMSELYQRVLTALESGELKGDPGEKGEKGDKGENGYTPVKGVDYFDGINGKDGTNGKDGKDGINGLDGYTPVKGVDYFDGVDGKNGTDGADGFSPSAKVERTTGGALITITDKDGTTTAKVNDGQGGGGTGDVTKEYLEENYYDKDFFEDISTLEIKDDRTTKKLLEESDIPSIAQYIMEEYDARQVKY